MRAIIPPPVMLMAVLFPTFRNCDAFCPSLQPIAPTWGGKARTAQPVSVVPLAVRRSLEDDEDESYDTLSVGGSAAERELKSMRYAQDEDFLGDDDDSQIEFAYDDDDEDYSQDWREQEYYEEIDTDDRIPQNGNFWTNPRQGLDPIGAVPPPRRRTMPPSTAVPHRRPPRNSGARTTFRSGTPAPPGPVKDLYDRLFWYGMDEEDGDWVPKSYDKTVFGGTRGKFNALAYLEDGYEARPPPRRIKRRLPPLVDDDVENYDRDANEYEFEDEVDIRKPETRRRRDENIPPRGGSSSRNRVRQPSPDVERSSNSPRQRNDVSSWFEDDDGYDDVDQRTFEDDDLPRPNRRSRRKSSNNPIVKFLDDLLDVDREDMATRADLYEVNVGRRRRKADERPHRSRSDFGYRYDAEVLDDIIDEDDSVVVDIEIEEETIVSHEKEEKPLKSRMSWEERSRRLEQVPPAGILAWGPSGDLGIDARTNAMLDAMEDLREAREQLKLMTERTNLARDDIVVLRADAALEEKKRQVNPRRARERLRHIQLDIEDAARDLRRAQNAEQQARERLEAVEDRHWAVLSLYDAEKASRDVDDSLAELSLQEPAARTESSDYGGAEQEGAGTTM
jgi:hypothetical protein